MREGGGGGGGGGVLWMPRTCELHAVCSQPHWAHPRVSGTPNILRYHKKSGCTTGHLSIIM